MQPVGVLDVGDAACGAVGGRGRGGSTGVSSAALSCGASALRAGTGRHRATLRVLLAALFNGTSQNTSNDKCR